MILPGSQMVLAQFRNVENRFIRAVKAWKQTGFLLAFLQNPSNGYHIAAGLILALHIKCIIGINPYHP